MLKKFFKKLAELHSRAICRNFYGLNKWVLEEEEDNLTERWLDL